MDPIERQMLIFLASIAYRNGTLDEQRTLDALLTKRAETVGAMTTTRVRIKIAVWPDGRWTAYGDEGEGSESMFQDIIDAAPGGESYHWIEADVPMPTTIKGDVT